MIHGLDTTFLVEAEVLGHPNHGRARSMLAELLGRADTLALAPQVLTEFTHVVTDPRRFSRPLSMADAVRRAREWLEAREVRVTPQTEASGRLFLEWLERHRLGRKRLLDTMLAATYHTAGVRSILTSNARDFGVFGVFEVRTTDA